MSFAKGSFCNNYIFFGVFLDLVLDLGIFPKYDLMNRDITENQRFWTPPDIGTRELGEVVRGRKKAPRGARRIKEMKYTKPKKVPPIAVVRDQQLTTATLRGNAYRPLWGRLLGCWTNWEPLTTSR